MTEAEWLTSPDPGPMLEFLRGKASDRKMRLFAIACWLRKVTDPKEDTIRFDPEDLTPRYRRYYEDGWCVWADERTRAAVEVAERFYDGRTTEAELRDAERLLVGVSERAPSEAECEAANAAAAAAAEQEEAPIRQAALRAAEAEYEAGNIFDYNWDDDPGGYRFSAGRFAADVIEAVRRACDAAAPFAELHEQAAAARDAAARAAECASEIEGVDIFGQNWQGWPKRVWDHFAATQKACCELERAADGLVRALPWERAPTAAQRGLLERLYASGAARKAMVIIERELWEPGDGPWGAGGGPHPHPGWHAAREALGLLPGEQAAALMRCVAGNPYRPASIPDAWRTSDVLGVARGICADRAFDRLPILADALQDAGCADEQLLGHCRGPGPHARGCWVVDLLLGKE